MGLPQGTLFLQSWARVEQTGGWHSGYQLPRRTRQAVVAGSVFLYFAPDAIPAAALTDALARLEGEGLGVERERGYGRMDICAAFHLAQAIEQEDFE